MFPALLDGSGSSASGSSLDEYDWESQGGFNDLTQHPDADVQACLSETDNVNLTVSDTDGNSDSVTKGVEEMCPVDPGDNPPQDPPQDCNMESVQDDFSGDDLSGSAFHERGSNDQGSDFDPWNPDPSTASLDVSSVLESGESSGEMTIEFAISSGFTADISCNNAQDPDRCDAEAEFKKDGSVLREVVADGGDDPSDFDENDSDLTFSVDDSDVVELETTGNASVGENLSDEDGTTITAAADISIKDIKLEVCN